MITGLTAEIAKDLVVYDPETGIFTRRTSPRGKRVGRVLGTPTTKGYLRAWILDAPHILHRVAWLYMTGRWPLEQIDHINHVRSDNRWANLRECTNAENRQNIVPQGYGVSGYLGVSPANNGEKWVASIGVNKKLKYLGVYDTPEAAHEVYLAEKVRLHTFATTGVSILENASA